MRLRRVSLSCFCLSSEPLLRRSAHRRGSLLVLPSGMGKNPEPLQEQTVFSVRTIDVASHSPSSSIPAMTSTPATRSLLVGVGDRAIIVATSNAVHQRRLRSSPAACEIASDEAKASRISLSPADYPVLSCASFDADYRMLLLLPQRQALQRQPPCMLILVKLRVG
ncbi:hypothetical protein GQ55_9G575200 [Panicum hallii var. hallii]|uniref:Uncharacterized protein n=1 Tax=Panicum hallii var. hallii TaxID=1504633 RepID=A0A2T7CG86_9POAL|nr:hypothetical protein GQ55_9G575200 [Panicum hallii var. hallii]